ncbi:MAG: methyltransferase [Acidobacteria bacterium]|nr:methyltransferase [Acidobacteriota bacterium]
MTSHDATSSDADVEAPDDAQLIFELLDGFRASKAAFTAVSLGVFDRLYERPASVAQLANELKVAEHALERLLGVCVAKGLLTLQGGLYSNLPPADRFLRLESPETLGGYVLYSDRVLYRLWGRLEDAVREGTNRWEQEFGGKENLFDHFFATDDDKRRFLAGMHGAGLLSSPATVAAFDLSRFKRMVDLGGGTGHLVTEACRRYPKLRGVVFDLPSVQPLAEEYVLAAGLEDHIEVLAGDFFTDELPPADLYAVGRILHDWADASIIQLLCKVHASLPEDGALLICEKLLNEERDGPATAYLQSLNMLVCTEGRERTASEYEVLVKAAGFRELEVRRTGKPVDVMLALK